MTAPRVVRTVGVAVAVLAILSAVQIARALPLGYDFVAYWSAARHLGEGAPLYPAAGDQLGQPGQFKYLPIVATLFAPLAILPFDLAELVWLAFETAVAVALGLALLRELPSGARPWAAAAYALFLPLILEVTLGNLDLVSVALMFLAWRLRDRPVHAAIPLALGVGLKLLPAAMLVFYVAAGRWRVVAIAAVLGVAGLAVTAPFTAGQLGEYVVLFPRLGDTSWVRVVIARDEPAVLAAVLWSTTFLRALSVATLAGVVVLGWMARRSTDATQLHNVALAISPYLAPFAFVWTTFLVMSLPLFASTLARVLALRGPQRALGLTAVVACWLLMDVIQLHDLVPVAAHLVAVLALSAIGLMSASPRQLQPAPTMSTASA